MLVYQRVWDNPSHWRTHIFQDDKNHQPGILWDVMEYFGMIRDTPGEIEEILGFSNKNNV